MRWQLRANRQQMRNAAPSKNARRIASHGQVMVKKLTTPLQAKRAV
jgi:hypothetical protein